MGEDIELDDEEHKGKTFRVDDEMADAVRVYVDYVQEKAILGVVNIETRFDLSFIHEGMFGTNDACVYSDLLGVLEVIDYKHGAGVAVSPEENSQLAYYGLGAANVYELHPGSQIKLTVIQPRAQGDAIKSWTTTVGYLERFAKTLSEGVKATQEDDPKIVEGDWCRFCPAQAVCPQLESKALEVAKAEFSDNQIVLPEPSDLNPVDIRRVLDFAPIVSSWVKSVEAYAFNELESGRKVEGYKLVKKRANRKWKDEAEAEDILIHQLQDKAFNRKLKSPAQAEKLVNKKLVASLCETPDSGNTMAPVTDKRPEVWPSIKSEFSVITEEDSD